MQQINFPATFKALTGHDSFHWQAELFRLFEAAALGLSPRTGASWRERCLGLLQRFGPAGLGYLESLLRAADVRASRWKTGDPILVQEVMKCDEQS
jgi:hypothetical protein